ncbi:MAG TPA: TonB-dependent receptor [Myxococcales bacterium]|nr:TonB-dependent receptor [Myxococcales bacterium]
MPPLSALRRYLIPFALAAAPLARAQEAGEQGETIEVQGQKPSGSPRAPAAAGTVVEGAQFGGEIRSVGEMLLAAPGVSVHAMGGPGQAATLSLRGASADQSVVLLDGIPLQGPGGGAVDLSTLPATLLDKMVISRGVLGAQFGPGALGGAVELVPRSGRGTWTGGATASIGSFGTALLAADASMPVGQGNAVLAVQGDRTDGDFIYSRQLTPEIPGSPYYDFTRENADATRGSALLRVSQELGADLGADLLLQGSAGSRGLPGSSADPTPLSRELDQGGVAGLRLRGAAGDLGWSLRGSGTLDHIELRGVSAIGDCQDGAPDCPREDQRSSSLRGEGELRFPLGEANAFDVLAGAGAESVDGAGTGEHQRGLLSLAVRDDVSLGAGVSLHPGLRFDRIGAESGLSPSLGVRWNPSPPLTLRAAWGLSFRAPTFSELYLMRGGAVGNPELLPERAWSVDAGAEWRGSLLTLSASAFWSSYRDLILYQLFPPARVKPFNVGEARIAGVELQAIVPLPAGFLASLSWSFLDAVNNSDGHSLAYRPPHRIFARLARRGDSVEGYGEVSYTSSFPRNNFDTAFVGSQLLLNAGAGLRVLGPLWIDVEAKNLLDNRTYEDVFQYPLPGFSLAAIARARI